KVLNNSGPWGLSALSKLPMSGIDADRLSDELLRKINSSPAMIYHGVKTEAGVLMRMNNVPRSIAEPLGHEFEKDTGIAARNQTIGTARHFLSTLTERDWASAAPTGSTMDGKDYKDVWKRLSGEV
ncbi:MAG: DEAD/DEAH box helicase, partial [bacterium]|nr:DEAD/DEAH box helicase [bacterium]